VWTEAQQIGENQPELSVATAHLNFVSDVMFLHWVLLAGCGISMAGDALRVLLQAVALVSPVLQAETPVCHAGVLQHSVDIMFICGVQVGGTLPGGILLRGMSGGERKRLAIACGVVAGPSLVFLDEPTSGLDSFAALNVVLFLKSMASQRGATLLASLHQPRSAIWNQMDQVCLCTVCLCVCVLGGGGCWLGLHIVTRLMHAA
jgi:hypothetical protein